MEAGNLFQTCKECSTRDSFLFEGWYLLHHGTWNIGLGAVSAERCWGRHQLLMQLGRNLHDQALPLIPRVRKSGNIYSPILLSSGCWSVCWRWRFDWSFARLVAPVVTTTSIILSSNKIRNGDVVVPANPDPSGKWPLNRRESVVVFDFRRLTYHGQFFALLSICSRCPLWSCDLRCPNPHLSRSPVRVSAFQFSIQCLNYTVTIAA